MASLEAKIRTYEDALKNLSNRFGLTNEQLMNLALTVVWTQTPRISLALAISLVPIELAISTSLCLLQDLILTRSRRSPPVLPCPLMGKHPSSELKDLFQPPTPSCHHSLTPATALIVSVKTIIRTKFPRLRATLAKAPKLHGYIR